MRQLILLAVVLIASCSATTPSTQQYLLRSDAAIQNTVQGESDVIGIGIIKVAHYIDNLGLALETPDGAVRIARDYQWAEPLEDSLRVFFSRELSAETGRPMRTQRNGGIDWKKRIDIRIDELHGTAKGEAQLVAYWAIFDIDQQIIISENEFSQTVALDSDGYTALVVAHKKLLRALSSAIAKTL
ncbi:MAG: membrane integrity-associated transporter subunit PqiC [Pseudomonadales bacterium]|nr:membrane integrity-associated transporter subunit PqiC [Pseudomonadales bacterium]